MYENTELQKAADKIIEDYEKSLRRRNKIAMWTKIASVVVPIVGVIAVVKLTDEKDTETN